jgi:hypothetical protein
MIQGSIPGNSKRFFTFPKHPDQLWGPNSLLFILPSLRMSGALPLLPLHAFHDVLRDNFTTSTLQMEVASRFL